MAERRPKRILVTGALGQIGSELVPALCERYGADRVVASDIRVPPSPASDSDTPFVHLDCVHIRQIERVVERFDVGTIYHLAALLSAVAEQRPRAAWELNMGGLYRILEVARSHDCGVFLPSSIGAFGPSTPAVGAPQVTIQRPTTMYGITKVASELLCDYYAGHFDVDARGLRLPGLISHVAPPGGGTTDYAVEIFYDAIRYGRYRCFLGPDTRLDMMYMPDALRGMVELMEADAAQLSHRNAFNVAAMSFTPAQAAEIRLHRPDFAIEYDVDPVRQAIADSWPDSMDDNAARAEWGWAPHYDLASTVSEMWTQLTGRLAPAS